MPINYKKQFLIELLEFENDVERALINVIGIYQAREVDANSKEYKVNLNTLKRYLAEFPLDSDFEFPGVLPSRILQVLEDEYAYRNFFDLSLSHGRLFKETLIRTLTIFQKRKKNLSESDHEFLSSYLRWLEQKHRDYFDFSAYMKSCKNGDSEEDLEEDIEEDIEEDHFDLSYYVDACNSDIALDEPVRLDDLNLHAELVDFLTIAEMRYSSYVVDSETRAVRTSWYIRQSENAILTSGHDTKVIFEQMVRLEQVLLNQQAEKEHINNIRKYIKELLSKVMEGISRVIVDASSIDDLNNQANEIFGETVGHNLPDSKFCQGMRYYIIANLRGEPVSVLQRFYEAENLEQKYDLIYPLLCMDYTSTFLKVLENLKNAIVYKAFESCRRLINHAITNTHYLNVDLRDELLSDETMTVERVFALIRRKSLRQWDRLNYTDTDTDLFVVLQKTLDNYEVHYQAWQDYLILRNDKEGKCNQPVYLYMVFSEEHKTWHNNPRPLLEELQAKQAKRAKHKQEKCNALKGSLSKVDIGVILNQHFNPLLRQRYIQPEEEVASQGVSKVIEQFTLLNLLNGEVKPQSNVLSHSCKKRNFFRV